MRSSDDPATIETIADLTKPTTEKSDLPRITASKGRDGSKFIHNKIEKRWDFFPPLRMLTEKVELNIPFPFERRETRERRRERERERVYFLCEFSLVFSRFPEKLRRRGGWVRRRECRGSESGRTGSAERDIVVVGGSVPGERVGDSVPRRLRSGPAAVFAGRSQVHFRSPRAVSRRDSGSELLPIGRRGRGCSSLRADQLLPESENRNRS